MSTSHGSGDEPRGDEPRGDEPRGDEPRGDEPRGDEPRGSLVSPSEFEQLVRSTIPRAEAHGYVPGPFGVGVARVTLPPDPRNVRAGGAVSGPVLFALADTALYAAVLTQLGPELMAVTSELSMRFVRAAPATAPLTADAAILKMGRRQAVGEVRICSPDGKLCTHAIGTYTLPLK